MDEKCKVNKSTDWSVKVGNGGYFFYMCMGENCYMMPLDSKNWWRCVQKSINLQGVEEKDAHWRCGHCVQKFKGEEFWESRILVLGIPGGKTPVEIFRCGEMSTAANNIMTLLKRSVVLEQLGDRPVTEDMLFEAISELNKDIDENFKKLPNYCTFDAVDPTVKGFRNSGQEHREVYCLKEHLSLKYEGTRVRALCFRDGLPEKLKDGDMENIMARMAAITDFESVETRDSKALRRAQDLLKKSDIVKEVRKQAYEKARCQK